MKTGKNIATNNYIVRFWSPEHYKIKNTNEYNFFNGTIQSVRTKEVKHFGTVAQYLSALEKMFKADERARR